MASSIIGLGKMSVFPADLKFPGYEHCWEGLDDIHKTSTNSGENKCMNIYEVRYLLGLGNMLPVQDLPLDLFCLNKFPSV